MPDPRRGVAAVARALALAVVYGCAPKPTPIIPPSSSSEVPVPAPVTSTTETPWPDDNSAPPDVAAPPPDATCTASGLCYRVLRAGPGTAHVGPDDGVRLRFTSWTTDGRLQESTELQHRSWIYWQKTMIPGWREALTFMTEGERVRLWVPEVLAYAGKPGKPTGMVVFDLELVSILVAPPPIPPPDDVAAPPADAIRTPSGLAYRVLAPGTGSGHSTPESTVRVSYTGWTTDGHMFDSSVARGKIATFKLQNLIPGWIEAVQILTPGEKARFWMPPSICYGDPPSRPGAPVGTLVYEIELVEIAP